MKREWMESLQSLWSLLIGVALIAGMFTALICGRSWMDQAMGRPPADQQVWHAVVQEDSEMLRYALASGSDINAPNECGRTPLVLAASGGSARMVDELLRYGADPSLADAHGLTPLLAAACTGNLEAVQSLCNAGARINDDSGTRDLPLVVAACFGHREVVEYLIAAGADINAIDHRGRTALDAAIESGDAEMASLLRRYIAKTASISPLEASAQASAQD